MVNRAKILYLITKSVWGGAGKHVYDLAACAQKKGYDAAVAGGGRGPLAGRLQEASIPFISLGGLKREMGPLGAFAVFLKTLKILFSFRPDILHSSSPQAAGIAGPAAFIYKMLSRKKLRTIFTVHGWSFLEDRPRWQIFFIRILSKITLWFYDQVICVSNFDRQIAVQTGLARPEKLLTIHNGISENEILFLAKNEIRKKMPNARFETDDFIVGTVGEFVKNKGYEYLVPAAGVLAKKDEKIKTVIAAWGSGWQKTRRQIENEKTGRHVILVRDLFPAAAYLKAFDVFVFPSLKEGLPYAVLEAGLAGIPVIASSVGGIPEIIEDGKTGLLIPPADPQKLTEAVLRLKKDPELGRILAQNLRQKVLKEFSKEKQLQKTFELYSNFIDSPGLSTPDLEDGSFCEDGAAF
ncbi:MAG: glycosyltransferase [Patescibacteria group bacterium]